MTRVVQTEDGAQYGAVVDVKRSKESDVYLLRIVPDRDLLRGGAYDAAIHGK